MLADTWQILDMASLGVCSVVLLFLSIFSTAFGLYFHISESEKKCFIEDIPDDTMVVGKYRAASVANCRVQKCRWCCYRLGLEFYRTSAICYVAH